MQEMVENVILNVLLALISLGCAYLTLYLKRIASKVKAEADHLQNQQQAEIIRRAIDRLEDVAAKTVEKLEQTVALEMRTKVHEGKLDREQLLNLGQLAYWEVIKTIEPSVRDVLQETLGDFETYTKNTIEAKVRQLKLAYERGTV